LGLFQFDRENDQLKEALGNPEHIRHIHGVGSQMSWKHGFPKDSTSYKKRDRYKKSLKEKIEDKVNMLFENRFMSFIQNLSQEHGSPPLHLLAPQAANLSSMGSMTGLGTWYPVDDITVDTLYRLHNPLGRVGNKTKEVVTIVRCQDMFSTTIPSRWNMLRFWFERSLTWDILIIHSTMSRLRESRSLGRLLISSYCGTNVKFS
jgi:hypothetical protein